VPTQAAPARLELGFSPGRRGQDQWKGQPQCPLPSWVLQAARCPGRRPTGQDVDISVSLQTGWQPLPLSACSSHSPTSVLNKKTSLGLARNIHVREKKPSQGLGYIFFGWPTLAKLHSHRPPPPQDVSYAVARLEPATPAHARSWPG